MPREKQLNRPTFYAYGQPKRSLNCTYHVPDAERTKKVPLGLPGIINSLSASLLSISKNQLSNSDRDNV